MRFKEFLTEELTTGEIRAKISDWRDKFNQYAHQGSFGKIKLVDNKIVHESERLKVFDFMIENGQLALPFQSCNKLEVYVTNGLTSFKNFPEKILYQSGTYSSRLNFAFRQPKLTSLEYFPRFIGGNIDTTLLDNLNLTRCNKFIDHMGGRWSISDKYVGPVLSLLLLNDLRRVYSRNNKLIEILNNHLNKDRDVMEAREELIAQGLKDYAKL